MLGSKVNIYPHISIPGDLCHYFLFLFEQNDALKNYCIDLFHTVLLFTFLEGQLHQMECNVVFANHFIALHLICLPVEICKQQHCLRKASLNLKNIFSFLLKISRTYDIFKI